MNTLNIFAGYRQMRNRSPGRIAFRTADWNEHYCSPGPFITDPFITCRADHPSLQVLARYTIPSHENPSATGIGRVILVTVQH